MRKIPIVFFIFASIIFYQCTEDKKPPKTPPTNTKMTGEALAKIHCATCHLYPSPDLLDKSTWTNFVLVRMASFMGIYLDEGKLVNKMPERFIEPGIGGQRINAANIYPPQPTITMEEWEKIVTFYVKSAPSKLPSPPQQNIKVGIPFFESKSFNKNQGTRAIVQSMTVNQTEKKVYAAEYEGGIYQYDFNGKLLDQFPAKSNIVEMEANENEFITLDMGTRYASDNPQGVFLMSNSFNELKQKKYQSNFTKLMRPVDFAMGDLTGNNKNDIVVAEYGNLLGALSWFEKKKDGSLKKHTLFEDDGSIKTEIIDLNNDGKNDIIALKGNSDEGIDWYINQGNGKFKRERKLRFLPTNGSTHFQLIDFDKDGVEDILYSNGDNGDYTPILKPYHGIRLFLNKNGIYKEEFFVPLNGVYQAETVDFDMDGDLDIAAVSFHPDFKNNQKEGFVVFINDGKNNFSPHTIKEFANSRWMRFVTVDIGEDKDIDILLSAMNIKTPEIPEAVAKKWKASDDAIILLENLTKN